MDFYYLYSISNLIKIGSSIVGIALFAHKSYRWAHTWQQTPVIEWGEQDFALSNRADYYIALKSKESINNVGLQLNLHVGTPPEWSIRIIHMPTKSGSFYILPSQDNKPTQIPLTRESSDTKIMCTFSLNPGVYRIVIESSTSHGQMLLPQCFKATIKSGDARVNYRKNKHLITLWKLIASKKTSV